MRLIDANLAMRKIREFMEDYPNATARLAACRACLSILGDKQQVPTIDPESLRPRGTWEGTADGYANGELVYDTWTCSECGYTVETDDPDDLDKALKDEMTRLNFWHDDAQVASEIIEKFWADVPGVFVKVVAL